MRSKIDDVEVGGSTRGLGDSLQSLRTEEEKKGRQKSLSIYLRGDIPGSQAAF